MSNSVSSIYKYHTKNLNFLTSALETNAVSTRHAISTQNAEKIKTFERMHHFLLGAWAEVRLSKLLHENNAFSSAEMGCINGCNSQLEKWNKVIELAFRHHYDAPRAALSANNLSPTAFHRYTVISGVVNNELKDIIELRNRIAHGQWQFLLNSEATGIEQDKMAKISRENLETLIFKQKMINYLANLIHDLVISPATFERDFDKHYKGVITFQGYVANKNYADYENKLVTSYQNGQDKKAENLKKKHLEAFKGMPFTKRVKILFF